MPIKKEERNKRYEILRNAGFNSRDANRYKDHKISVIYKLIELRDKGLKPLKDYEQTIKR